ncbi:MAG: TCR/Tet family MFS transporter [Bacteriovoracia bacterium]
MPSKTGRAAFIFIFITVALDMLALGIMVPVLPKLVVEFEGGDIAKAAAITGVFGFAWALMQFIFSPVVGALSDHFGRRPVVLLSNFGLGLDYLLMALAPTVGWLFVGRVISGITAASFSAASAYIADVSPPEKRAAQFGMLGAAFGLGFVVGPAIGGMLGAVDLRLPFWVASGLSLANAAYGYFILPESLPPEKRAPFSWRTANPIGSIRLLRSRAGLLGLGAIAFLSSLAHESLPSIFVLYTHFRYHWDEKMVGFSLAAVGICSTLVSAVLVGKAVKKFGERTSLILGLSLGVIGFGLFGMAETSGVFMTGILFTALWGIAGPAMQALMTRKIGPTEQGQLQGALSSLRGITGMAGPLFFTQILAAVARPEGLRPLGAPYLAAALLLGVGVLVSFPASRPASEDLKGT